MTRCPELTEALDAWENSLDEDNPSLHGERDRAAKRAAISALFDRQREDAERRIVRAASTHLDQLASLSSQLEAKKDPSQ